MKLLSSTVMATSVTAKPQAAAAAQPTISPLLCLIAGWLVPGAGPFLLKKPIRGALLFLSIVAMFAIGIGLAGKIYQPNTGDLLDILNFVGQLGNGLLYILARSFDWGHAAVQTATEDYGTKFIVVAGLLNVVSAVDAHSLASGRKAS
jgi:TM2 domain-containing membrane protein YozV